MLFSIDKKLKELLILLSASTLIMSCTYENLEDVNPCVSINSTYIDGVAPLIKTRCALSGCHNGDSLSVGNYNIYTDLKLRVENGQFKIKVFDSKLMPPVTKPPLTSEEFNLLKCWVDAGAPNN